MSYILTVRTSDYPKDFVKVLRKQLNHELVVLGDDIPFIYDFPIDYRCWFAMEVFRPDIPKPFLYLDLDNFVYPGYEKVFSQKNRLISREWNPGSKNKCQNSTMWLPYTTDIWNEWISNPDKWMMEYQNDQHFMEHFDWSYFQDEMPGFVGSYKVHDREKPTHTIIQFHGKPKMKEARGWAQDRWNSLNS